MFTVAGRFSVCDDDYVNFRRVMTCDDKANVLPPEMQRMILLNLKTFVRKCDSCDRIYRVCLMPPKHPVNRVYVQEIGKTYHMCSERCFLSKQLAVQTLREFGDYSV